MSCHVMSSPLFFVVLFLFSLCCVPLSCGRASGDLAVSMAMHTDDLSSDDDEENRNTVGRGEWKNMPPKRAPGGAEGGLVWSGSGVGEEGGRSWVCVERGGGGAWHNTLPGKAWRGWVDGGGG